MSKLSCKTALAAFFLSSKAWVYMSSVVDTCEWPNKPETVATSVPPAIISEAAV